MSGSQGDWFVCNAYSLTAIPARGTDTVLPGGTLAWSRSATCTACGISPRPGPFPKGPRTQIIGFQGPNTIILMVFGP